jgi:oligosaccharide repeat unit polymerase
MLSFRPFFVYRSSNIYNKLKIRNPPVLFGFSVLYCICALISVYFSIDTSIRVLNTGNWAELYSNSGDTALYENQLERFAKIFVQYTQPLAIACLFYYLTLKTKNKWFCFILFVSIILPTLMICMILGMRGPISLLFIYMTMGYLCFERAYGKKTKKMIAIGGVLFLICVLSYTLAVTDSRFGDSSSMDTHFSFLEYFGGSMLHFDYGIADSIKKYMYGDYLFNTNQQLYVNGFDSVLGTHFRSSFFTFVGTWYLDFGPIGTLLVAILLPLLLFRYWRKKQFIDMADLYLYLFYLQFLTHGVFVQGCGYFIQWVMFIVLFALLKILKI